MPLFECSKCGCIENTATGDYWRREYLGEKDPVCSECATGEWHGHFIKKSAKGMLIDQRGYLWSKALVDDGRLPAHFKIVGVVGLDYPAVKHVEDILNCSVVR